MKWKKRLLYLLLTVAAIPVVLFALLMLLSWIGFSRPPSPPLENPKESPAAIWWDADNRIVFVSDAEGKYYGLKEDESNILWIDFEFENRKRDENRVVFYATDRDSLKEAVFATETQEGFRKVCEGKLWLHSWRHGELDIYCNDTDICIDGSLGFYRVVTLPEAYLFWEAEDWPAEVLQWMAQREQKK